MSEKWTEGNTPDDIRHNGQWTCRIQCRRRCRMTSGGKKEDNKDEGIREERRKKTPEGLASGDSSDRLIYRVIERRILIARAWSCGTSTTESKQKSISCKFSAKIWIYTRMRKDTLFYKSHWTCVPRMILRCSGNELVSIKIYMFSIVSVPCAWPIKTFSTIGTHWVVTFVSSSRKENRTWRFQN